MSELAKTAEGFIPKTTVRNYRPCPKGMTTVRSIAMKNVLLKILVVLAVSAVIGVAIFKASMHLAQSADAQFNEQQASVRNGSGIKVLEQNVDIHSIHDWVVVTNHPAPGGLNQVILGSGKFVAMAFSGQPIKTGSKVNITLINYSAMGTDGSSLMFHVAEPVK